MRTSRIALTWVLFVVGSACSSSSADGVTVDGGEPGDAATSDATTSDAAVDATADATGDASGIPPVCAVALTQMSAACQSCLAAACMTEASDCCKATSDADAGAIGCLPLAVCAIRTRCQHAGCNDPATCQREVSGAGGPLGQATNVASALGACIQSAAATNASCARCLQ